MDNVLALFLANLYLVRECPREGKRMTNGEQVLSHTLWRGKSYDKRTFKQRFEERDKKNKPCRNLGENPTQLREQARGLEAGLCLAHWKHPSGECDQNRLSQRGAVGEVIRDMAGASLMQNLEAVVRTSYFIMGNIKLLESFEQSVCSEHFLKSYSDCCIENVLQEDQLGDLRW